MADFQADTYLKEASKLLGVENKEFDERMRLDKEFRKSVGKVLTNPPKESAEEIFSRRGQAKEFIRRQPLFYDKSGLWWIWDFKKSCWEKTDEVEILNRIEKNLRIDVINSKAKSEVITSLQLEGRKNLPEKIKPTLIQFKNGIIDVENPEGIFVPNPSLFVTNPIPWNISDSEVTPTMDRIFKEWVGEDYVKTLYEIIAYCLIPDYPIHRIFCFVGSGLNGKSKFLELLRRFIGDYNVTCTELDVLLNSRFEITRLHKKLVAQMGETNFNEMNKTSILKKLSGGDLIGFEYKRKDPFEDKNYAKILISTNNLPTTTDKTIGFYRRWLIIDFPNRFTEKKEILSEIPTKEYENLARKSIKILNELLIKREFHLEGTIEERMDRFESKSNPFDKFWNLNIEEDFEGYISKRKFYDVLNQWCKENGFRMLSETTISKHMKEKGVYDSRKTMDWIDSSRNEKPRYMVWQGIKFITNKTEVNTC